MRLLCIKGEAKASYLLNLLGHNLFENCCKCNKKLQTSHMHAFTIGIVEMHATLS